ncbi:MAG: HDOD domain-containing protein [Nitrospirae bacterium]|nr:HDOD domain-containing protein [Nitrospirota bacterium]
MKELLHKLLFEDVDIPSMPEIATKILAALEDKHSSVHKIANLVLKDQSLTANILRIANTPYYQTGKHVTKINDAIMSLGMHNLIPLISIIMLRQQLMSKTIDNELLEHSCKVSIISSLLATEVDIKKEEALIAGLLHDVGILIIFFNAPSTYNALKLKVQTDKIAFVQAENEILGGDHCHIGSLLAKKWNFPPIYDYVIKHHHDTDVSEGKLTYEDKLCYLVRVADHIVFEAGIGIGQSYEKNLPRLLSVLRIGKETYDSAVGKIQEIDCIA